MDRFGALKVGDPLKFGLVLSTLQVGAYLIEDCSSRVEALAKY